jgi:multidrug efflux pump subunit AcrA (membrane-fusion protein)
VDGTSVVFVKQSPVRFERRAVQIGSSAGEVLEVLQGLEPGEEIVGAGSFHLKTALLRELIGDEH